MSGDITNLRREAAKPIRGRFIIKTLILYISYSGNTKAFANKKAAELKADIEEIQDVKKPSVISGVFKVLTHRKSAIQPIKSKLSDYSKIIIMSPVWAGSPVSAINSVIECLPAGKQIEFFMISAGGGTKKTEEGTKKLITSRNCEVTGYTDVKIKRENGAISVEILNS